ncbi:O-antigen polymerase [Hazenella coriacea]|uniref:O-antigen polymerase n=1 Tax=Hazenella coriacea TaxID=1179467 RepID=UPI00104C5840|nr:O-antigen polymerase [Hazenella coriacea]
MFYVLIWLIVLGFSIYFFKKASGTLSLTKLNLHSIIFYYSFLVSSFIGSLLIVLEIDESYIIAKLIFPEQSRIIGFTFVCIVMVLFPCVMFLVSKLLGFRANKEFDLYWNKEIDHGFSSKGKEKEFFWVFLGLTFLSLGSIIYTFAHIEEVPIFAALFNSSTDLAVLRIEAKSGFTGNVFIRNIFAIALTPILSLIAYIYKVKTKDLKWSILFYLLFIGAILINIYDFQKSPVIFYFAMFLLVRMYIGKTRLNPKLLLVLVGAVISYLLLMYSTLGVKGSDQFLSYSTGPIGRVILTQIAPMYVYVDRYGDVYPFLYEKGLPESILEVYGIDPVRSARVLMEDLFPEKVVEGTAGVLNTLYVGEAYATFGVAGVILGTIYIAAMIQILYIIFLRLPKHPVYISLFTFFIVNIPRALVGGFSDLLVNPIWILLTLIVAGSYLIISLRDSWSRYTADAKGRE